MCARLYGGGGAGGPGDARMTAAKHEPGETRMIVGMRTVAGRAGGRG